jgi:hypothetical protein
MTQLKQKIDDLKILLPGMTRQIDRQLLATHLALRHP